MLQQKYSQHISAKLQKHAIMLFYCYFSGGQTQNLSKYDCLKILFLKWFFGDSVLTPMIAMPKIEIKLTLSKLKKMDTNTHLKLGIFVILLM